MDDRHGEDYYIDVDPNDKVKAILVYELIDHARQSDIKFLLYKNKDLYNDYLIGRETKHCPITEKYFENLSKSNRLDFSPSGVTAKDFAECFMKNYDEFEKQYHFQNKNLKEVSETGFPDDYKYTPFIEELYEHIDNQTKEKSILENNYPDFISSSIISPSHTEFSPREYYSDESDYYKFLILNLERHINKEEKSRLLEYFGKAGNEMTGSLYLARLVKKYDIDQEKLSLPWLSKAWKKNKKKVLIQMLH